MIYVQMDRQSIYSNHSTNLHSDSSAPQGGPEILETEILEYFNRNSSFWWKLLLSGICTINHKVQLASGLLPGWPCILGCAMSLLFPWGTFVLVGISFGAGATCSFLTFGLTGGYKPPECIEEVLLQGNVLDLDHFFLCQYFAKVSNSHCHQDHETFWTRIQNESPSVYDLSVAAITWGTAFLFLFLDCLAPCHCYHLQHDPDNDDWFHDPNEWWNHHFCPLWCPLLSFLTKISQSIFIFVLLVLDSSTFCLPYFSWHWHVLERLSLYFFFAAGFLSSRIAV